MTKPTVEQIRRAEMQEKEIDNIMNRIHGKKELTAAQIEKLKMHEEILKGKAHLNSNDTFLLNEIQKRRANNWKPFN